MNLRYKIILFVLFMLLYICNLGIIETNIMELRNLISAREMLQNKEYFLTTLNGLPRYEKPPLPTWLTALSEAIFGMKSFFTLRLPAVLASFILMISFFEISKSLKLNLKQSFNNTLILLTSFYIFLSGRDNQWDIYTHSFMVASILFQIKIFTQEKSKLINLFLGGLFFGFSILSKGPVSLYALWLPFIISYIIIYKQEFIAKYKAFSAMLLLGLVFGFSWYMYVRYKDPAWFHFVAKKETSSWTSHETKPFYYYWSFFTQSGIWTFAAFTSLIYPYIKKKTGNLKVYKLTLLWTLFSLILLSVIPEKKTRYLLPILVPLALNTGFYIDYLLKNFQNITKKTERYWVYFSFGILAIVGFSFPVVIGFILSKEQISEYLIWIILTSVSLYIFSFLIIKGLYNKKFEITFYAVIAMFTGIVIFGIPISEAFFNNPDFASSQKLHSYEKKYQIKSYEISEFVPEYIWDYGKPINFIKNIETNQIEIPKEKSFGILSSLGDSNKVFKTFKNYKIKKIAVFDMNSTSKKSNSYRERLVRNYYWIKFDNEKNK